MNTPDKVNWPAAGRYVLAVSGGVDSMALLDLMAAAAVARGYELTVAHFDHGIRPDSSADRRLVEQAAAARGLECVAAEGRLGAGASEAGARAARHEFLLGVAEERRAQLVTAHHQDDLLETSLLNLARGSGRRGLAPLAGGAARRPLLAVTKAELTAYAKDRGLRWHEDSTNLDLSNPRNFLRRELLPAATAAWRAEYLALIGQLRELNADIDGELARLGCQSDSREWSLGRAAVRDLSLAATAEWLLYAARCLDPGVELHERLLAELALFAKTGRAGRRRPLTANLQLEIGPANIMLKLAMKGR